MSKTKKCDSCGSIELLTTDEQTGQELCADCLHMVDCHYCPYCNSVIHQDNIEWLNDCPLCECGAIISL
jgi:phage terminase large subunit GpA-like protein